MMILLFLLIAATLAGFSIANTGSAVPRFDLLGPILFEGMSEDAYVTTRVLPTIVVEKRNGAIPSYLFTDAQFLSIKHSPKTAFATVQSTLGQGNFSCTEAGVEEKLSFEDYEILGRDRAWEIVTRRLVHIVLRARDVALSQAIFSNTGKTTFATNLVHASAPWSGGESSTGNPLFDVLTAKRNIALQTGTPGNAMLIGYDNYINICTNKFIRTAVRNNFGWAGDMGAGAVAVEIPVRALAMLFSLDEVIVASGVVDTNQTAVPANQNLTFIWDPTYALVFRKAKNPSNLNEIALGRTFVYDLATEFNELTTMNAVDSQRGLMIESYPDPFANCDHCRAREYIDMEILAATTGALIWGC